MKIIDLLNKIANDIDVPPKQIKYDNKIFEYKLWLDPNKYAYVEKGKNNTLEEYCCFYDLNDEVEIIEEDKKIEKLINIPINYADDRKPEEVYEYLRCTINNLANVINISNEKLFELIDKVNKLERGNE